MGKEGNAMDDFTRIKTFIKVVEAGSFSAAARDELSVSTVARQIQSLEVELGVRLLNRSTRRLSLTDAGRRFFERVNAIAHELKTAKAEVSALEEDIKGRLRVSLRITAGTTIVVPALPRFLSQYPDLELEISLTDERQDLIANNIDVSMWLGDLPNSQIVARRLCRSGRIVCGSPDYFARHGVPRTPQDLRHHNCMLFTAPSYRNAWGFTRDGKQELVEIHGNVRSDNGLVLLASGLANVGVMVVHTWMVRDLLADGRLTRVLSEYVVNPRPGDADLFAVFPSTRGLSRKVRVFVDFLVDVFNAEPIAEAQSSPNARHKPAVSTKVAH
jgi:DNA-binding transcriptional LysR family regulator